MKAPGTILYPTSTGLFWLLAVLALLATAVNYGNNLVFALAFLLLATWLQGAWECWRNLTGLTWQAMPVAPVFAGERCAVTGTLADPAGRPHRRLYLSQGRGRSHLTGPVTDLPSGAHETLEILCPTTCRGHLPIPQLVLVSAYPLGLWQARCPLPPVAALVYPHPGEDQSLPPEAPNPAHRQQESDDFQGVRGYVPGDSPRRINWRVYGRREELVVNSFDGGRGGHALWLDLEHCAGDLEQRLSQLARWILAAEHQGLEYGLRLGSASLPPSRGRPQRDACLKQLALYGVDAP